MGNCNYQAIKIPTAKQKGNVLVLFVISLFSLIVMAALALDGGHLILNKGRLQNLVDAAALNAAKEIDLGGSRTEAITAVHNILTHNLANQDQAELSVAIDLEGVYGDSTATLTVEFSQFPDPFVSVEDPSVDAPYVKVSLTGLTLDNFLANVFSFNKQVSASALAGPSTAIKNCFTNLVPMMVCAESTDPATDFGLTKNQLYMMKIGSNASSPIGPGNFQLIRLGTNSGADDIRSALAGEENLGTDTCTFLDPGATVPTEPGNTVGPVAQGLNTRMGKWQGPVNPNDHPRDSNICQGEKILLDEDDSTKLEDDALAKAYRASDYLADNENDVLMCTAPENGLTESSIIEPTSEKMIGRRVMNVVIGQCDGLTNGANNVPYLGVGCFFLTQKIDGGGKESYVIGEFMHQCPGGGNASLEPVDNPGPYKIILFHVPGSKDS